MDNTYHPQYTLLKFAIETEVFTSKLLQSVHSQFILQDVGPGFFQNLLPQTKRRLFPKKFLQGGRFCAESQSNVPGTRVLLSCYLCLLLGLDFDLGCFGCSQAVAGLLNLGLATCDKRVRLYSPTPGFSADMYSISLRQCSRCSGPFLLIGMAVMGRGLQVPGPGNLSTLPLSMITSACVLLGFLSSLPETGRCMELGEYALGAGNPFLILSTSSMQLVLSSARGGGVLAGVPWWQ